ncbi:MAG: hypothetical protein PVH61_38030, partial [Candidatus Aminicenantes bacterium]
LGPLVLLPIFYLDKSQHKMLLFLYSNIPLFHYSCLEYAKWLPEDSLLSTICRISETFNY